MNQQTFIWEKNGTKHQMRELPFYNLQQTCRGENTWRRIAHDMIAFHAPSIDTLYTIIIEPVEVAAMHSRFETQLEHLEIAIQKATQS